MQFVKFMYDKGGVFTERKGFIQEDQGDRILLHQLYPEEGTRTFLKGKIHDLKETESPWTYERPVTREFVLPVIAAVLIVVAIIMWVI